MNSAINLEAEILSAQATTKQTARTYRINSIDLLRGLVMIIMALDHTRDFFHSQAFTDDPLNLATTTPWLYFTRWITHFCAPVFIFLAGTSSYFQSLRKNKKELSKFLIQRGLWLVFIEFVIMSFAFSFDVTYSSIFLQTIWAIGTSMIVLGLAIWLPFNAILTIGLVIVFGHNLIDFAERAHTGPFPLWWQILHRPGFHNDLWVNHNIAFLYPILPWIGLMMLGYCFGKLFTNTPEEKRTKTLSIMGVALILLFIILRSINVYGDPNPWGTQKTSLLSFFSFMNVNKYPPSLMYMCITIGPALLFLAFIGNAKTKLAKIITVYGRVPFFYYILHFYMLHVVATLLFFARGHSFNEGINNGGMPFKFILPGEGYSLPIVYLIWIAVVAFLYPLCKWYSNYKAAHKEKWWLSYL